MNDDLLYLQDWLIEKISDCKCNVYDFVMKWRLKKAYCWWEKICNKFKAHKKIAAMAKISNIDSN